MNDLNQVTRALKNETTTRPDRSRTPNVRLRDLAAYLGLSKTTVSRVINNTASIHRIPEETQRRVRDALNKLQYRPNLLARELTRGQSSTVGVLVPRINEGYFAAVLAGIEEALTASSFFYFVVSHKRNQDTLHKYLDLLLSRCVEGIIAVDTPPEENLPVPLVVISGKPPGQGVHIMLDHIIAARLALGHLVKLGHRRIAFIKGQVFSSSTEPRWQAIRKVAAEFDISIDPMLTAQLEGPDVGIETGRTAMKKLLSKKKKFSAVFAYNDTAALGAISAIYDAGLRVPDDISVVGFDDILSAQTSYPPLTTVRQPLMEMGRLAADTLLAMMRGEGPKGSGRTIRIQPTLVERRSTSFSRESIHNSLIKREARGAR